MAALDEPIINSQDDLTEEEAQQGLILVRLHPQAHNVPDKPGATRQFLDQDTNHPKDLYPDGEVHVVGPSHGPDGKPGPTPIYKVFPNLRVRQAIATKLLQDVTNRPGAKESPKAPQVAELLDESRRAERAHQDELAKVQRERDEAQKRSEELEKRLAALEKRAEKAEDKAEKSK